MTLRQKNDTYCKFTNSKEVSRHQQHVSNANNCIRNREPQVRSSTAPRALFQDSTNNGRAKTTATTAVVDDNNDIFLTCAEYFNGDDKDAVSSPTNSQNPSITMSADLTVSIQFDSPYVKTLSRDDDDDVPLSINRQNRSTTMTRDSAIDRTHNPYTKRAPSTIVTHRGSSDIVSSSINQQNRSTKRTQESTAKKRIDNPYAKPHRMTPPTLLQSRPASISPSPSTKCLDEWKYQPFATPQDEGGGEGEEKFMTARQSHAHDHSIVSETNNELSKSFESKTVRRKLFSVANQVEERDKTAIPKKRGRCNGGVGSGGGLIWDNYPANMATQWLNCLPFYIHFELRRILDNTNGTGTEGNISGLCKNTIDKLWNTDATYHQNPQTVCTALHEAVGTKTTPTTASIIIAERAASQRLAIDKGTSFCNGTGLYFSARLTTTTARGRGKDGWNIGRTTATLHLLPPAPAYERRVFRRFGSHRFLHVAVVAEKYGNCENGESGAVKEWFLRSHWICGRRYRYVWAKLTSNPQSFIMFAEMGVGISKAEEMDAETFMEWCIPPSCNPGLSLGKKMKRMKLCFSQTNAAGVLLPQSVGGETVPVLVEVVDEFCLDGLEEIDGCGLISRAGLNFVWQEYVKNKISSAYNSNGVGNGGKEYPDICPHTGFQGRLGGFKGCWVLDEGLRETETVIHLQCRKSQLKYNVPQRCLSGGGPAYVESAYDEQYDTVEVCSWDDSGSSRYLSTRLIQILEARGVPVPELLGFVDSETECLKEVQNHRESLIKELQTRNAKMAVNSIFDATDQRLVYKFALAGLDLQEPNFAERRERLVRTEFNKMQQQGRYKVKESRFLRLYADHTLLLEEGEAFLACSEGTNAKEVLAMRYPAYFAADLRKLTLVSSCTLFERARESSTMLLNSTLPQALQRYPMQKFQFFTGLKNCLVLCNKRQSEASRMSGGDYDGDQAWVSWNETLLQSVQCIPAEDTSTFTNNLDLSSAEKKPVWEKVDEMYQHCLCDELDYVIHFRFHQIRLGTLSEWLDKCIDYYGLNHRITKDVGRANFLQVDHPFYKCKLEIVSDDHLQALKWPHWKGKGTCYKSTKAAGKVWDHMEFKIQKTLHHQPGQTKDHFPPQILRVFQKAKDTNKKMTQSIVDKMKNAAVECNRVRSQRRNDKTIDKHMYCNWFDDYCKNKRLELIDPYHHNVLDDKRKVAAVILYHECFKLHFERKAEIWIMDFSWRVAEQELFDVVTGNCLRVVADQETTLC